MFIAMNRFKVRKGAERDFEQVWLSRETHLENVPGFIAFHLLKGPERDLCALRIAFAVAVGKAFRRLDAVGGLSQGA